MRSVLVVVAVGCGPHDQPLRTELAAQAEAAYDRKDWASCAAKYEAAEQWYGAASCRALAGDRDAAFALLARVTDPGLASHAEKDTDFASLHDDPRWTKQLAGFAQKSAAYEATINHELRELYRQDQADRDKPADQMDWSQIEPRDKAREKRVDEILASGGARVSNDYYAAAMVFQHSQGSGLDRAHELALMAVLLDPSNLRARWLTAASEDRILVRDGKPQKWATQYSKDKHGGPWKLDPVDPSITDEQRAAWNVPPLAVAKARADEMNGEK